MARSRDVAVNWAGQVPCHPVEVAGCVYVEVPKAGCSSVKWALSPLKGGPPEREEDIHRWFGYTHARDVGELQDWLETRWANLYRFTIVRDPIARFESFYYGLAPHERGCYGDISRYVLAEFERDPWRWDIHVIPQTLLIGRQSERFDFIGRTEDMGEVQRKLRAHVSTEIHMPHLNRSTTERDTLTADARRHLKGIYAADYEAFGYV